MGILIGIFTAGTLTIFALVSGLLLTFFQVVALFRGISLLGRNTAKGCVCLALVLIAIFGSLGAVWQWLLTIVAMIAAKTAYGGGRR